MALLVTRAEAQVERYPLHDMNFDMWCQEQKHLAPERCDRRLPADDAEFEAYRSTIERYEIPYLEQREHDETLNRVIIHGDPEDNPTVFSQPQSDTTPPQQH